MHELFAVVLRGRDLSRAGDLFSVENDTLFCPGGGGGGGGGGEGGGDFSGEGERENF